MANRANELERVEQLVRSAEAEYKRRCGHKPDTELLRSWARVYAGVSAKLWELVEERRGGKKTVDLDVYDPGTRTMKPLTRGGKKVA